MDDRITTVEELRDHMAGGGDLLNIFVATSVAAFNEDAEQAHLCYATRFQVEGYVLHPRHLTAEPVEIVTDDREEVDLILKCVRESQAPLAERQATANMFASQRLPTMSDLHQLSTFAGLGEMVEALKEEAV